MYLPDDDDVEIQLITLLDDVADVLSGDADLTPAAGCCPGCWRLHWLNLCIPTAAEEEVSAGRGGADDLQEREVRGEGKAHSTEHVM